MYFGVGELAAIQQNRTEFQMRGCKVWIVGRGVRCDGVNVVGEQGDRLGLAARL